MTDEHRNKISIGTKNAWGKIKQTNLKKYGKEYYTQTEEYKIAAKETCMDKYGVPYSCMRKEARTHNTVSQTNKEWKELLDVLETEFVIDKYSYDLKKDNVLIEINPSYTHNSTIETWYHKQPLDKNYHYNKSKVAMGNNYFCFHIWDWDDKTKIINYFKDKSKIYGRQCVVKEVSNEEADEFLNTYHFQNTCKNQLIRLGLYYNGALVQLMTFGKPRYNKNYEYELLRLCSKTEYIIIGGSERLFKYFISNYNPESIISYCDNAKFHGYVYKKLGFILKDYGKPSRHWYNIKTKRHITDNLLRWRGFSQLHGDNKYQSASKGDSNEKLMINNGYIEVYDCGQSIYIWKNYEL